VVCRPANLDLRSPLPKPDKTRIPSRSGRPAPDQGLLLHAARMPEWSVSRSHKKWFKTEAFRQAGGKYGAGDELLKVQGIECRVSVQTTAHGRGKAREFLDGNLAGGAPPRVPHFLAGRCSRPLFLWTWKQRFVGLGGARNLATSDASAERRHTANYR
jgi:hypothetical protein